MNAKIISSGRQTGSTRSGKAFTITEMMVAMAIFSLTVIAVVELHLFGLRQNQLVLSKLGATDQARIAFGHMLDDIRGAKMWQVGNVPDAAFIAVANGEVQQGGALKIYATTNSTPYILYYFNDDKTELRRATDDSAGYEIIADHLTNSVFFRAEDYQGRVKTDLSYKYVIGIVLHFQQFQYPQTAVGPGCLYDDYKLEFKVAPHSPAR
jgi:prepilin-type N-terminal cleavage/methylation domain-containing protein